MRSNIAFHIALLVIILERTIDFASFLPFTFTFISITKTEKFIDKKELSLPLKIFAVFYCIHLLTLISMMMINMRRRDNGMGGSYIV